MSNKVVVHKGRTNTLIVNLGYNVSSDTFASEIRSTPSVESPLLATWTITFLTDGTDGKLKLVLDNSITSQVEASSGFMDLKRTHAGEPVPVFDQPLEVDFRETVTE